MKRGAVTALVFACTGCFGTPTPLAPGLSGSVGVPHHGVLTEPVELPRRGDGFVRYRPYGKHYWGNERLVGAIRRAAATVEARMPGGAPLVLGDLSAERGGKIPRHHSHRTGRDIDILWYVTTPRGAPIKNPGFIAVDSDALALVPESGRYVRLDVPRQWLLIKTLLEDPQAHVQWMFASRAVEALIVDYARARGEPDSVVWRAETVLLQPGDSLAHDDHIHLRLACTPREAVQGCAGGGPHWEWLPPRPRLTSHHEWIYDITGEDPFPSGADEEKDPSG